MNKSLCIIAILLVNVLFGASKSRVYYVVNLDVPNCGMFSVFNYVVGVLYHYNQNPTIGIEVNFGNSGYYYDPRYGSNWWNYYFEPIKIGSPVKAHVKKFNLDEYFHYSTFGEKELNRFQVNDIIQKYIHIREPIRLKVEQFVKENFDGSYVIAVHYRGTDKSSEAPRVPYESFQNYILEHIATHSLENYKIFIATDEVQFLNFMNGAFPDKVIYYSCHRSNNGVAVHVKRDFPPYDKGEEALIDCVLLSRGNFLFRTSSNLSNVSTFFNPHIPVIELSRRY